MVGAFFTRGMLVNALAECTRNRAWRCYHLRRGMIEFKHFIYLDVYRTGSTHIIKLLRRISLSEEIRIWRHYPITTAGYLVRPGRRVVFTSVRNPWDWYVSLWSHGVDGHSAIRRFMLGTLPEKEVASYYDREKPAQSFGRWLAAIHDPAFVDANLEEGYPQSRLSSVIGLYSYRFQRVTTRFPWFFLRRNQIRQPEALREFHRKRKVYSVVLKTENLTEDLASFVETHGARCNFKEDAADILRKFSHRNRNASTRLLPHYRDYYTDESAKMVAERDRFFLDEFGYSF